VDTKEEIRNNTIVLGDTNISHLTMDQSTRQKINKEMLGLNCTLDQVDLTDMHKILSTATKYVLFSIHKPDSRVDYASNHETSLNLLQLFYFVTTSCQEDLNHI
jgi:hypothetical protein